MAKKLKIFVATDSNPNPKGLEQSNIWERNLIDPLGDLGHDVIRFDYDLKFFSIHANPVYPEDKAWQDVHRPELEAELLRQIKQTYKKRGIDIFLSYFWDAHATPTTIREINALGILTINWFCNGSYQFHMVKNLAPAYDFSLVPEKFRLGDYKQIGARPIYFQEAANPRFYQPKNLPQNVGVSFVGQCYGNRVDYIAALHKAGLPVQVYGPNWVAQAKKDSTFFRKIKRTSFVQGTRKLWGWARGKPYKTRQRVPLPIAHPSLSDDEMVNLYSRSKISLGFSTCGDTDRGEKRILQVRLRDMEAPMCGAFYLVERFDELAQFFEYGKEIEGYESSEELIDKCKFYLAHETQRQNIARSGLQRARREHTWQARFEGLFKKIGMT